MKKVTDASFIEVAQIAAIAGRNAVQRSKEMNQTQVISQDGVIYRCKPDGVRDVIGFVGDQK
jgi:hypothetical protein